MGPQMTAQAKLGEQLPRTSRTLNGGRPLTVSCQSFFTPASYSPLVVSSVDFKCVACSSGRGSPVRSDGSLFLEASRVKLAGKEIFLEAVFVAFNRSALISGANWELPIEDLSRES